MSALFEELDYCPTPIGPISLRRRKILSLGQDVYEVILGDDHLMSSIFTASEVALADRGLAILKNDNLDVVVGGLGLGYTAQAVLSNADVASLAVVELLEPVIRWHAEELVPLDPPLKSDPRCKILQGDFFKLAASTVGFDAKQPGRIYDAILIDIDHTPENFLNNSSSSFYSIEGFERLMSHLKPGGIMGLWSDDEPDDKITARLASVFEKAWGEPVTFPNPLQNNKPFTQSVYFAQKA